MEEKKLRLKFDYVRLKSIFQFVFNLLSFFTTWICGIFTFQNEDCCIFDIYLSPVGLSVAGCHCVDL